MAETGQLNWANFNYAGCQFAKGAQTGSGLNGFYAPKDSRTWGSTVSYLESHDEQRLAYEQNQYGESGVKGNMDNSMNRLGSAAAQMIMSPGAHMIWQFSELGNYDSTKNSDGGNNTDPKVVRWSLFDNAKRKGLYTCYSELIAIRNDNPELFSQEASFENSCAAANWANGRTLVSRLGDKEIFTVVNPNIKGDITVNVTFSNNDDDAYQILSKSYNSTPSFSASANTVTVPANCYVVIASKSVAAVEGVEADVISNTIRAYSLNGEIVVDYAPAGVSVYTVDGKYAGKIEGAGRMAVASGIYILRSGKDAMKLIVK